MKLRTATPASVNLVTKSALVIIALIIAIAVPLQVTQSVFADKYDDQISALQQDIQKAQAQAAQMATQAQTLQTAVAQIQVQVTAIQGEIDLSQAKYNQLVAQIADTEKQIKDNQDALGETIANLYVDAKISPLEMLASSKNISDYLDKQEYRNSVRDQLTSTIAKIQDLKTQLTTQKADTQKVLDQQGAQKAQLAAQQAEQQNLLTQTQGQEAAYQQIAASAQQKVADAAAAQRAYYQSLLSSGGGSSGVNGSFQYAHWSGNQGCSGGYPAVGEGGVGGWGCNYALDYNAPYSHDQWALFNRECVSYVAWALQYRFNRYVGGFSGQGMAYQWPSSAPAYSGAVRVYDPQPGDAVILPKTTDNFAPIGHAMVVESSADSNGWIHVSQFNFYGTGQYSTMDIKSTGVVFLRFPPA